jgi:pimeloyl-ACP methyl ester carboxylesterase
MWPRFFTAYYFADKVSLMSSVYTHRYDSVDHRRLGAMPLVVLWAEDSWGKSGTPESVWFHQSYSKVWIALQEGLANLSSHGVHKLIKGSGHQIELEKPQTVIDAADEVLRQLHTGAKS